MQMLQDAILPDRLDKMRKIFDGESEFDERAHAQEFGEHLRQRREANEEFEAQNRHARRKAAALAR